MIAKLKGVLDSATDDQAIIDVGGVGYLVFCSARTLRAFPERGKAVEVFVETHVREDHIHLYGFATEAERSAFKLLTSVQGVGAKVGLAILSVVGPDELVSAVAAGDKAPFTKAAGVGPKLAQRLVSELADKTGKLVGQGSAMQAAASTSTAAKGPVDEAVSALVNLGYGRMEAFTAVNKIAAGQSDASVEVLIKDGLKALSAAHV